MFFQTEEVIKEDCMKRRSVLDTVLTCEMLLALHRDSDLFILLFVPYRDTSFAYEGQEVLISDICMY